MKSVLVTNLSQAGGGHQLEMEMGMDKMTVVCDEEDELHILQNVAHRMSADIDRLRAELAAEQEQCRKLRYTFETSSTDEEKRLRAVNARLVEALEEARAYCVAKFVDQTARDNLIEAIDAALAAAKEGK